MDRTTELLSAYACDLSYDDLPPEVVHQVKRTLIDTLGRLVDWPLPYASAPSLFCFGLLAQFDIPDLLALSAPVPLYDNGNRGPLRP